MTRKGIILAGGTGSRLYPITRSVSKQLLPVYDKPMIYYPLSVLMLADIRDIVLVTAPDNRHQFEQLLGDGSDFGLRLSYCVQDKPEGIAQALLLTEDFVGDDSAALILGDNIFYGQAFVEKLRRAHARADGATVFAYLVNNPEDYGVVELGPGNRPTGLVEKPRDPRSRHAVTGLYFYDNRAVEYARTLTPSARGELEITDLNRCYLEAGSLAVEILGRGFAWLDTGTQESLLDAAQFVQTIEQRQGLKIACLEEIAFRQGWIAVDELRRQAARTPGVAYSRYLEQIADENAP